MTYEDRPLNHITDELPRETIERLRAEREARVTAGREWEILGETLASYIGPIPRGLTIEIQRGNYLEPVARDKIRYRWEFNMDAELDGKAIMDTSDPKATVRDLLLGHIEELSERIRSVIDAEPNTSTILADLAADQTKQCLAAGTFRRQTYHCLNRRHHPGPHTGLIGRWTDSDPEIRVYDQLAREHIDRDPTPPHGTERPQP